jgi:aminoglycoside phosphotransferase (APT) family kinase protein
MADVPGAGDVRTSPLDGSAGPALRMWFEAQVDGVPPYEMTAIRTASTSNEMWEVCDSAGSRWALRCPPAVGNAPTAHDIAREYRLLVALEGSRVPHPGPIAICADASLLGRPFYVMSHVDGVVLQSPVPPWVEVVANQAQIGVELLGAITALSAVDWRAQGLDGFGKPGGYLERQVDRWLGQLAKYRSRDLPGLSELAAWLRDQRVPEQSSAVLHGDYSLFNVLFAPDPPARLIAVVDWETATIGDPLVDLGWLVAQWSESGEAPIIEGGITQLPGMVGRRTLVERYAAVTGRDVTGVPYYAALASFKLACIVEGAWYRYSTGQNSNPQHARFERLVPNLIQHTLSISRDE